IADGDGVAEADARIFGAAACGRTAGAHPVRATATAKTAPDPRIDTRFRTIAVDPLAGMVRQWHPGRNVSVTRKP
ncbi:MAG TPA: hypothetical protein VHU90_05050, partial [Galbitalea sp.]|nr:hypothetical protein [Galbitalea sp.]